MNKSKEELIKELQEQNFLLREEINSLKAEYDKDITERKHIEEVLKTGEARFRSIINISPVPMALNDDQQNITFLNPAFIQTFGYTLDDIPTLAYWWPKAYPDLEYRQWAADTWQAEIEKAKRTGTAFSPFELTVRCKNGMSKTVLASASSISNSFEGNHLVVLYDITERKRADEALKEALVKAEASDHLKTAFINNISHEVRTPLNGILGFGQLMAEPDISAEERSEYLEVLNISSYRLINTITDIMDISLIVSGGMEIHKKTFNVKQYLDGIHLTFGKQCSEKNLSLSLHIPEENNEIHTDTASLGKILFQLLDNAVKFTETGGITFGYTVESNTFRFFVKDTGVGVKQEARNRIFENFMQENISDTRGHEGSGLGLSIAKGLVELLGGEIGIESVKCEGSTFFFTIPSGVTASGMDSSLKAVGMTKSDSTINKTVILIAEDDNTSYALVKAILKNSSVKLLSAITGKEAVVICRDRTDISLILMDLKMPVMNGFEAAKLIKSFRKNLPIIAVTAHTETGAEHRALSAGCDDYITKPYNKDELMAIIKKWVGIVK